MTFYLVGGAGASTTASVSVDHLPGSRVRRYPSDTTDAEWQGHRAAEHPVAAWKFPGIALFIRRNP
jgi:hypothetical protein